MAVLTDEHGVARLCYLTTTGRRTGNAHEIEMWFARDGGDRIYMLSGGGRDSDWVRNLLATPKVAVRIDDVTFRGTASPISGLPDEPIARRLLAAKYQDWSEGEPLSDWAMQSFPVAIDLEGSL
ncbi:MAG: nitroreductase family deazaflavin-dependent oxidoreductase [Thermomicrobiales bacterium]